MENNLACAAVVIADWHGRKSPSSTRTSLGDAAIDMVALAAGPGLWPAETGLHRWARDWRGLERIA